MTHEQKMTMYKSMEIHGIKGAGISWFSLLVDLDGSDTNQFKHYPRRGVLRFCEQGTDLSTRSCVFHLLNEDGSLGAPCEVINPRFTSVRH
tara:strand:+ start:962 stop:1234 length:273 start_codon:yes stop_codon:yes gene_type:complete